jgi:hypothetical protein
MMAVHKMTMFEAMSYVRKRRSIIFPNIGFQRQLMDFERLLKAQASTDSPVKAASSKAKKMSTPNRNYPTKMLM